MSWTMSASGMPRTVSRGQTYIKLTPTGTQSSTEYISAISFTVRGTFSVSTLLTAELRNGQNSLRISFSGTGSLDKTVSSTFTFGYSSSAASGYMASPDVVITVSQGGGTIDSITGTVTTTTVSNPISTPTYVPPVVTSPSPTTPSYPRPPIQAPSAPYNPTIEWSNLPSIVAAFATPYASVKSTIMMDQNLGGNLGVSHFRMVTASGSITWKIKAADGTYIPFTISGTTATSHTLTVTEGIATATITIPSTLTAGPYRLEASGFTGTPKPPTTLSRSFNIGSATSNLLAFTTEPSSSAAIGDIFSSVVVTAKNTSLATVTAFVGTVTLKCYSAITGQLDSGALVGTTTATAVAGVATFAGLSFSKPGQYNLRATATGYADATSVVITITGAAQPNDLVGLRQNYKDDGSLVAKTNNIVGPTVTTATATERSYIDGDMASTNAVATDGFRVVFPHTIKLKQLDLKWAISTLTGSGFLSVYTSTDATTTSNGTYTLQTSYTPDTTSVHMKTITFATPVLCKSVWVTLNDNGGAATASWRAIHITGPYIGPSISFTSYPASDTVGNENILSIPYPANKINGAATVTRTIGVRNNTSSDQNIGFQALAARSSGDSLITGLVTMSDENGDPIGAETILPAYSTKPITFTYTITSALNDSSGKHIIRFSLITYSEATAILWRVLNSGVEYRDMATFGTSSSQSTGGETYTDMMYHTGNASKMILSNNAATTFVIRPMSALSIYGAHTITAAGTAANFSRAVIMGDYAYVTNSANTNIYKVPLVLSNTSTALSSITIPFTIAAGTSGAKVPVARSATRMWIMNGTTSDISIYDYDINGTLYNTITTATNLSGRTVNTIVWDSTNNELYVVTTVSGGSRIIARYNGSGVWQSNTSNSDQSGSEVTGGWVMAGKLYLIYAGQYLYRYDVQTLANGSLIYTGAANTGTGRMMIVAS